MEQYDQIGARLDRLPLARFHYRIFGIISFRTYPKRILFQTMMAQARCSIAS